MKRSEVWKQIPAYEGVYVVSTKGRIKRIAGGQGAVAGRILKPRFDNFGYEKVRLYRKNG